MKKLLVLLVFILAFPSLTAYAVSSTSRRFVVRNWKAEVPVEEALSVEDVEDEVEPEETMEPEEPAEPEEPVEPVDDQTEPPDDEAEPPDDEVEPSDPEETAAPVEDHSEEIEEHAKPVEGEQSVPDNSGAIEPEDQTGQEEPEDGGSAETIDTPVDESEDSVDVAVIDVPPAVMDTKDEPDGGPDGG